MFAFQDTRSPVDVAFTDRHGGTSGGPFASLDLSTGSPAAQGDGDAPTPPRSAATWTWWPRPSPPPRLRAMVAMHQVHGADVHVVDETAVAGGVVPVADAMVTALPDVALLVRVADCVPVVLADPAVGVVGVAHGGRPGLAAGVVPHAVRALRELGAGDLTAWVGPHVCGACYEVPEALRAEVAAVVPEAYATTAWGTPSLDIGAGVRAQLDREGVTVLDVSRCTLEDDDLFSYRRQGRRSGRLGGLVRVRGDARGTLAR